MDGRARNVCGGDASWGCYPHMVTLRMQGEHVSDCIYEKGLPCASCAKDNHEELRVVQLTEQVVCNDVICEALFP